MKLRTFSRFMCLQGLLGEDDRSTAIAAVGETVGEVFALHVVLNVRLVEVVEEVAEAAAVEAGGQPDNVVVQL